jgi:hypothetical protein
MQYGHFRVELLQLAKLQKCIIPFIYMYGDAEDSDNNNDDDKSVILQENLLNHKYNIAIHQGSRDTRSYKSLH